MDNLMHKMTNPIVEIIKATYNGVRDRRILRTPTGVHQVEANPSSSSLEQKINMLTKQKETLMKA